MKKILILSIVLIFSIADAELYIWTDENGVKRASDTPPPVPEEEVETHHEIEHSDAYYKRSTRDEAADYWEREIRKQKLTEDLKESQRAREQKRDNIKQDYEDRKKEIEIEAAERKVENIKDRISRYEQYARDMKYRGNKHYYRKKSYEAKEELREAESELRRIKWER